MTATAPKPIAMRPYPARPAPRGSFLLQLFRETDPKKIGVLYLVTTFAFFMLGGAMAMLLRSELARPGMQFLSAEQYNQLFTMHGTVMLLPYATPVVFGFANLVLPLQISAPDVAFPRLNALSFWLLLFSGLIMLSGFVTPDGAADFGWFAYTPLSGGLHSPGVGGNLWIVGVAVGGLDTILGAVNMITTIGAYILGASTLPFIWNVFKSYRYGETTTADDPWGYGNSLEWATTTPPPRHNFLELPRIRSERPAFELHYPHMVEHMRAEAHAGHPTEQSQ